jgi:hypothetical protein
MEIENLKMLHIFPCTLCVVESPLLPLGASATNHGALVCKINSGLEVVLKSIELTTAKIH